MAPISPSSFDYVRQKLTLEVPGHAQSSGEEEYNYEDSYSPYYSETPTYSPSGTLERRAASRGRASSSSTGGTPRFILSSSSGLKKDH